MQGKADETERPRNWAGCHRRQRKSEWESRISPALACTNEVARREVMVGVKLAMPTDARTVRKDLPGFDQQH